MKNEKNCDTQTIESNLYSAEISTVREFNKGRFALFLALLASLIGLDLLIFLGHVTQSPWTQLADLVMTIVFIIVIFEMILDNAINSAVDRMTHKVNLVLRLDLAKAKENANEAKTVTKKDAKELLHPISTLKKMKNAHLVNYINQRISRKLPAEVVKASEKKDLIEICVDNNLVKKNS